MTVGGPARTADGVQHRLVLVILLLAVASRASAVVLGGGLADTDCTVGFDGVSATDGESGLVCTDGDPACDADGMADGSCHFDIRVCTRLTAAGCTPRDVSSITVAGLSLAEPPLSGSAACGASDSIDVPVGSAAGATLIARDGGALKDVDYLNVCCRSAAAPFDAAGCALMVEPSVAGCARTIPHAFVTSLANARDLVAQASAHPGAAKPVKRAVRALRRMRSVARRIAKSDPCGDALGLVATHAITVLRAATGSPVFFLDHMGRSEVCRAP